MPTTLLSPADPRELLDRLAELRRRQRLAELARGGAALGAVLIAGPALVGLLDARWHLPPLLRAVALVALLLTAGLVLARLLMRPLRRRLDNLAVALRIEAHYPVLNDGLASAVEFLEGRGNGSSDWLRQATIDRAVRQAHGFDLRSAVRTRGTIWAFIALIAACALAVPPALISPARARVALTRLADPFGGHDWPPKTRLTIQNPAEPHLRTAAGQPIEVRAHLEGEVPTQARLLLWLDGDEPLERPTDVIPDTDSPAGTVSVVLEPGDVPRSFRYRLLAGDGDSGWRSVDLVTPPELVLLDGRPSPQIHLDFPAYTDLPPRDLPDGGRVLKAVVGTVVRLRAATDRPIDHAALIYRPRNPDPVPTAAALAPLAAGDAFQVPGAVLGGAAFTEPVIALPVGDGRLIEMTFVPKLSGTYLLTVVDATGIGSTSEFDIRVLPDPAPKVALERPAAGRDSLAVLPEATITLAVRAEDQLEELPGAVRDLTLEYRVSIGGVTPSPFEQPQRLVLFDHATAGSMAPSLLRGLTGRGAFLPPATPLRVRTPLVQHEQRVPVAALRRLDGSPLQPGDSVTLQAVGTDFDDVSWAKEPGRSAAIELRIVTAAELETRLQQGQANLRRELLRVQQWQREATQKAADAQQQLQQSGRLTRPQQEGLFQSEQLQQRIRERVGTEADGLRAEAARLRQALRDNPLPPSPARQRLEAAAEGLEKLAHEVEPIDGLLSEARREEEALAGAGVEPRRRRSQPLAEAQQKQREAERQLAGLLERLEPWSGASEVHGEVGALLDEQRRLAQQTAELQRQLLGTPKGRLTREQQGELDRAADRQARLGEFASDLRQKMNRLATEKGQAAEERAKTAEGLDAQAAKDQAEAAQIDRQAAEPKQQGTPQGAQMRLAAQALRERAQAAQAQANDLRDQARALRKERDALQQAAAADRTRPPNPEDQGVPSGEQLAKAAGQIRQNQLGEADASQRQGADALERVASALDERQAGGGDTPQRQLSEAEKQVGELLSRQEELQRQAEAAKERVEELKRELERRKQEAAARGDQAELKRLEKQGPEELRRAEEEKQQDLKQLAEQQKELERQARELAERLSRQKSPAAKPVEQAAEQMSRAAGQMEQGDAAERTQDDALDRLDEAQRTLDQQREQAAQGELMREQRAKLLDRLKGLQGRQVSAVEELDRIHQALKKSATFPNELADSLSNLRDSEERLRGEVESLAKEKFEGLPVFADFLKQSANALDETTQQLDRRIKDRPGPDQPLSDADREAEEAAQRAILKPMQTARRRLTQLLDAVKEEMNDRSAQRPRGGQPGGGGGGGGGGGEAIPPKAQLRAMRALQAELKERTESLAKQYPDPEKRPEEAEAELKSLREAQSRLLDLFRDFSAPEAPAAPAPTPTAPPGGKAEMPVAIVPELLKPRTLPQRPAGPKLEPAGPAAQPPQPRPMGEAAGQGGMPPGDSEHAQILDRLVQNLRDLTRRLDDKDASDDTQKKQQEVLDDIDRLLNPPPPPPQDQQQQQQQDQSQQPMPQSQDPQGGQSQGQQQNQQSQQGQRSQGQQSQGGQSSGGGSPQGGSRPQPQGGSSQNQQRPQQQPGQQQNLSRSQQRALREQAKQQQQPGQQQPAEQMAARPSNPQGGQQGNPGNPLGPRSTQRRPGMPDPADAFKETWGQLPERERAALDQFYKERFLPRYEELLKQYYATIAERNGKRTP